MFPLNSNQAYIKETGERTTLGAVVGGGGGGQSELPEYSIADAGKVLAVDDEGELEWATVSSAPITFVRTSALTAEPTAHTSAEEVTT